MSWGQEAEQGTVRDLGEKGDHRQAMGKGSGTLEILLPLDPEPTPGMGEAKSQTCPCPGELVGSQLHLLALPLLADQPSHILKVFHLLLSQGSQALGLLSLNCKQLSELFGEQDPKQEGWGSALSKALCTEDLPRCTR